MRGFLTTLWFSIIQRGHTIFCILLYLYTGVSPLYSYQQKQAPSASVWRQFDVVYIKNGRKKRDKIFLKIVSYHKDARNPTCGKSFSGWVLNKRIKAKTEIKTKQAIQHPPQKKNKNKTKQNKTKNYLGGYSVGWVSYTNCIYLFLNDYPASGEGFCN